MCGKIRSKGTVTVAAFLLTLLAITALSVQVGADPQLEVVRSYDAALGELPEGIAFDKRGNLYVSFMLLGQLRKIGPDGSESVLLDLGESGAFGLAVDASGDVYMAHFSGVYRVTKKGAVELLPGTDDILWSNALAFDKRGNLYVTDSWGGAI